MVASASLSSPTLTIINRWGRSPLQPVSVFDIGYIVRNRILPPRHCQDLIGGNEEELGLRINEFPNQPGTSHAVHLYFLTRYPFHRFSFVSFRWFWARARAINRW